MATRVCKISRALRHSAGLFIRSDQPVVGALLRIEELHSLPLDQVITPDKSCQGRVLISWPDAAAPEAALYFWHAPRHDKPWQSRLDWPRSGHFLTDGSLPAGSALASAQRPLKHAAAGHGGRRREAGGDLPQGVDSWWGDAQLHLPVPRLLLSRLGRATCAAYHHQ